MSRSESVPAAVTLLVRRIEPSPPSAPASIPKPGGSSGRRMRRKYAGSVNGVFQFNLNLAYGGTVCKEKRRGWLAAPTPFATENNQNE